MDKRKEVEKFIKELLIARYCTIKEVQDKENIRTWRILIQRQLFSLTDLSRTEKQLNSKIKGKSHETPVSIVHSAHDHLDNLIYGRDIDFIYDTFIQHPFTNSEISIHVEKAMKNIDLLGCELSSLMDYDYDYDDIERLQRIILSINQSQSSLRESHEFTQKEERKIIDILGVFISSNQQPRIELYADRINHLAGLMSVTPANLAFVVLTHELAHAYTIAGFDEKGNQGQLLGKPLDKHIIEGLAQYYTETICQLLDNKINGVHHTYLVLLANQLHGGLDEYTWQKDWFQPYSYNHEVVRKALFEFRKDANMYKATFERLLY